MALTPPWETRPVLKRGSDKEVCQTAVGKCQGFPEVSTGYIGSLGIDTMVKSKSLFGFKCFVFSDYHLITTFPLLFPSSKPSHTTLILSSKLMASFSLIVILCIYVYNTDTHTQS